MTNNIGGFGVSGGNTSPDVFGQFMRAIFATGDVLNGLTATQATPSPNMTVLIATGVALLTKNTISSVAAAVTAAESVTISTANPSNPRIDTIVLYEDTDITAALTPSDSKNERFKLVAVAGTPAGSPSEPSSGAITTAIGAGKAYTKICNVAVAAGATNIVNANLTDKRSMVVPTIAPLGVTSGLLASGSATPSKLGTGASAAYVATSQTTNSTSYADLATTTDSVTLDIGANGLALVSIFSYLQLGTASGEQALVGFAVSGATTVAATDSMAIKFQPWTTNAYGQYGATFLVTGLAPGSTTFKMKYRVTSNTGTFYYRRIAVVPL